MSTRRRKLISPTAMAGGNTGLVLCQVGGQCLVSVGYVQVAELCAGGAVSDL